MSNFFWRLSFESDIKTKSSAYNRQDIFVPQGIIRDVAMSFTSVSNLVLTIPWSIFTSF